MLFRSLTPVQRPLSELVAELPRPTLVHRQIPCPWAMKGLVMRVLNERFAGRDVDLTDGIKVFVEGGWVLVQPDPDAPYYHVVVSVEDEAQGRSLLAEYAERVRAAQEVGGAPVGTSSVVDLP